MARAAVSGLIDYSKYDLQDPATWALTEVVALTELERRIVAQSVELRNSLELAVAQMMKKASDRRKAIDRAEDRVEKFHTFVAPWIQVAVQAQRDLENSPDYWVKKYEAAFGRLDSPEMQEKLAYAQRKTLQAAGKTFN